MSGIETPPPSSAPDLPPPPSKRPRPDVDSLFAEDAEGCEGTDSNWGPAFLGAPKKFAKRWDGSKLFLTYPHCSKPKDQVLASMELEFPVAEAIIAQETHSCGHKHIHAYVKASKRLQFKDHGVLDRIGGKHGDYKTAKGRIEDIAKYLSKEDPDPLIKGLPSLKSILSKQVKIMGKDAAIVAEMLKSGSTAAEVMLAYPGVALQMGPNRIKQVRAAFTEIATLATAASLRASYLGVNITQSVLSSQNRIESWTAEIFHKIRKNVLFPRQFKNIWISGPTRCGKSRFISQLREVFDCYLPPAEKYWSSYRPDAEMICFDEEDPFMMGIRRLNGFSGGNLTCPLMIKCQAEVMPTRIQPMVVCTQISLSERIEQYKQAHVAQGGGSMDRLTEEALRDRFIEVVIPEGQSFHIDWIKKVAEPGVELPVQQAHEESRAPLNSLDQHPGVAGAIELLNEGTYTLADLWCHEEMPSTTTFQPQELNKDSIWSRPNSP